MLRKEKCRARREEIRRNRPDAVHGWNAFKSPQTMTAIAIALGFWLVAVGITSVHDQIVRVRPEQFVHEDVLSRVAFDSVNQDRVNELRQAARDAAPRVYRVVPNCFANLERQLLSLPSDVSNRAPEQLPRDLKLDSGAITLLKKVHTDLNGDEEYRKWVHSYIEQLSKARDSGVLVVLPKEDRSKDLEFPERKNVKLQPAAPGAEAILVDIGRTFPRKAGAPISDTEHNSLMTLIEPWANQNFQLPLSTSVAAYTIDSIAPTHELDQDLSENEQNAAAERTSIASAKRRYYENSLLVAHDTTVPPEKWRLLNEEQQAYIANLTPAQRWTSHLGMAALLAVLTAALAAYVGFYQPRIIRNRARAAALAALLLLTLVVAQVAVLGTAPLLVFGTAPTLLVAMILAIAYERRFAMGIATLHGLLVTAVIGQGVGFFLIIFAGILTACFLLDEVRSRSKLVEVGGATALAMMAATFALGALDMDPRGMIGRNCLHAGAAALGVGFVVLGILPFIERAFKITTAMTLLELADASHPLLRRLQMEAPGTYNHSLQVATLAEAAAESIGADSLLCRVGSYYHDVGKMNKAEYFCENQFDGPNRHLNLNPNVSLLIIIGHVKDGIELAKEYNLPPSITPIIAQHHGTTLVEFFYHQARKLCDAADPEMAQPVSDTQYRYPGPKPRTREAAIVMVADCVESATRAMVEPTANRVETLVHDLVMKRLLDGQFDESDMTFAELEIVERTLVKTVLGIYHGRLAYPSTAKLSRGTPSPAAVRSA
jgi:putative nucleotidyltransferase with HDIG domain